MWVRTEHVTRERLDVAIQDFKFAGELDIQSFEASIHRLAQSIDFGSYTADRRGQVAVEAGRDDADHAERRGGEDADQHPYLRFGQLDHPCILPRSIAKIYGNVVRGCQERLTAVDNSGPP